MIERVNRNGVVFIASDGVKFEPRGELKEVDFSLHSNDEQFEKEYMCVWGKECTVTVQGNFRINNGFLLYIKTGKELFLRCPKKIKRSRKWRALAK